MMERERSKQNNKSKSIHVSKAFCLFFICMCFLTGCSDKAVSFALDTQEQQEVRESTENLVNDLDAPQAGSETVEVSYKKIKVYVCGAVQKPGVVELSEDSRAEDALEAAGGLREDAGLNYVNLAAKVEDEQMLYFPTKEEIWAMRVESKDALININTAGEEQLCTLPGIGASRASDIITYREAHGAFKKKEDIMQVSGIKESLYEKICDYISVE